MSMTFEVGGKLETWFSCQSDGLSTILEVQPYRGRYPQWFTHVLKVTAPRTSRGWLEVAVGPDDVVSPLEER